MQRELLMFKEIPIVVTATRRAQLLTQAPSAITIITGEEIRQSGATSLPELLQVVPGLDMFRTSASNVSIATRGLNKEVPVRIQVLVDGLSIYEDLADVVFWYEDKQGGSALFNQRLGLSTGTKKYELPSTNGKAILILEWIPPAT